MSEHPEPHWNEFPEPHYMVAIYRLDGDAIRVEVLKRPPVAHDLTDEQIAGVLYSAAEAISAGRREPGIIPAVTVEAPE